jgi:hypothetical protein
MSSALRGVCTKVVAKSHPQIGQRHKLTISSVPVLSDHLGEINLIPQEGHFAECRALPIRFSIFSPFNLIRFGPSAPMRRLDVDVAFRRGINPFNFIFAAWEN